MRIPLTRYGMPHIILTPIIILVIAGTIILFWQDSWPWVTGIFGLLALFSILFFRDPERDIPTDNHILLAPADGKITDIVQLDTCEYLECKSLRIGIFLSVFDVHVNRIPCSGKVEYVQGRPGLCLNALKSLEASEKNQAVSVGINCASANHPAQKILIRQITGAIARRIVCDTAVGDDVHQGDRYGMIKYGSRTELFLPMDKKAEIRVHKGDTVRGGITVLVRYQEERD